MGNKMGDREIRYTRLDCNLMNLMGMFRTSLLLIRTSIQYGDYGGALHRIDQTEQSIKRLQECKRDAKTKAKQISADGS